MSDVAFNLLMSALNHNGDKAALWLVDENIDQNGLGAALPAEALTAITNRYDLHQALMARGFKSRLADYDFSGLKPASLAVIYYRVSKEKALVHHIINSAAEYLQPGGQLLLAGYKNEGIKSYVDKAAHRLAGEVERQRGGKGSLLATLSRAEQCGERLDDRNYRDQYVLAAPPVELVSKPGVYGWNKVDKGSAFLIEHLAAFLAGQRHWQANPECLRVVDLGCGYGYLSVMASQLLNAHYIATDNNIAAVDLCRQNFLTHHVTGEVVVDDCGSTLDSPVDLLLCNPPFHQGFEVTGDLTLKFLQASHRLLGKDGRALFVVNSFIGIEKKARGLFRVVDTLGNNGSFKVIALTK